MTERHDLVIGIGNTLRGDDGVGWWLAQRAETLGPAAHRESARSIQGTAAVNARPLVRSVQQLTPELAEELQNMRRVLFIDAWWQTAGDTCGRGMSPRAAAMGDIPDTSDAPLLRNPILPSAGISFGPIDPVLERLTAADGSEQAGAFSHQLEPSQLLAITALLHGRAPEAWRLLVPAWAMGHGEGFSSQLERRLPKAEDLLVRWCCGECCTQQLPAAVGAGTDLRHA